MSKGVSNRGAVALWSSHRGRAISAAALLLLVAGGSLPSRLGWSGAAQLAWVGLAVGASVLGALWWKSGRVESAPRLKVLARAGLSPRCGLALVEVDGCTWLVAFGDGFVQFADPAAGHRTPLKQSEGGLL